MPVTPNPLARAYITYEKRTRLANKSPLDDPFERYIEESVQKSNEGKTGFIQPLDLSAKLSYGTYFAYEAKSGETSRTS